MVGGFEVEDGEGGSEGGSAAPDTSYQVQLQAGAPAVPSPRRDLHRQRQQDQLHGRWGSHAAEQQGHRLWAPKPPRRSCSSQSTLVASERALLSLRAPLRVPDYWSWRQSAPPVGHSGVETLSKALGAEASLAPPLPPSPSAGAPPLPPPMLPLQPSPRPSLGVGSDAGSSAGAATAAAAPGDVGAPGILAPQPQGPLRHAYCVKLTSFPLACCELEEHPAGGLCVAAVETGAETGTTAAGDLRVGDRLCMIGGSSVLCMEAGALGELLRRLAADDEKAFQSLHTPEHGAAACRITAAVRRCGALNRGDEFKVSLQEGPLGITMEDCLVGAVEGQAKAAGVTENCLLLRVAGVKVYDDFDAITVIKSVKRPIEMWFAKQPEDEDAGLTEKQKKVKQKAKRKQEQKDAKAKRKKAKEFEKARKKALKNGEPPPQDDDGAADDMRTGTTASCLFVRTEEQEAPSPSPSQTGGAAEAEE